MKTQQLDDRWVVRRFATDETPQELMAPTDYDIRIPTHRYLAMTEGLLSSYIGLSTYLRQSLPETAAILIQVGLVDDALTIVAYPINDPSPWASIHPANQRAMDNPTYGKSFTPTYLLTMAQPWKYVGLHCHQGELSTADGGYAMLLPLPLNHARGGAIVIPFVDRLILERQLDLNERAQVQWLDNLHAQ